MERLTMTQREIDKMSAIHGILESRLTWGEAASQLRLSSRQIGRLVAKLRLEVDRGVINGLRGRPSTMAKACEMVRARSPAVLGMTRQDSNMIPSAMSPTISSGVRS